MPWLLRKLDLFSGSRKNKTQLVQTIKFTIYKAIDSRLFQTAAINNFPEKSFQLVQRKWVRKVQNHTHNKYCIHHIWTICDATSRQHLLMTLNLNTFSHIRSHKINAIDFASIPLFYSFFLVWCATIHFVLFFLTQFTP